MTFPAGAHKEAMLFGRYVVRNSVVFLTGTTGAVGNHDIFTVTGAVHVVVVGYCTASLTGATATISVGTDDVVAGLIAVTTGTNIDADMMWFDAGPSECEANASIGGAWVCDNISYDVLVAPVDTGTINFVCYWTPVSDGATVVAA
jgi:hypothetical protein